MATATKTRTEILISGFGGQGVVRMGQILGLCAIKQGHRVTMLKSHGTETRGGYVRAQLVHLARVRGQPRGGERRRVRGLLRAGLQEVLRSAAAGAILYDPEMVEEIRAEAPERHVAVPATALAKERFGNALFANMIMLGALTRAGRHWTTRP